MSYGGEIMMELVRDHGYTDSAACAAVLRHDALVQECARKGFLSTSVTAEIARVDRPATASWSTAALRKHVTTRGDVRARGTSPAAPKGS